jgi:hypothetical protein
LQDPILKVPKAKRVGGMAQMVECLIGKLKALSSRPMPQKQNKATTKILLITTIKDHEELALLN